MKDWTGNKKTMAVTLGASNHTEKDREENDYYATDPKALEIFLDKLKEDGITLNESIWECACGEGHLSKILENAEYTVTSTDLIDREYGIGGIDFLKTDVEDEYCLPCITKNSEPIIYSQDYDILTNPPYKYAKEFVEKGMELLFDGNKLIMFLKIQFLEGQLRKELFKKYPPKYVYVNSARQLCSMNGEFEKYSARALCYCWFIWEKGFNGEPIIRWI